MPLIDFSQIEELLQELPGWSVEHGRQELRREYTFQSFAHSLDFVNKLGAVATKLDHYPDIDIRWNVVRICTTSRSAGGLTENDFTLAKEIEALA